ncbi:helix-turn-helix domain containing protein [Gottfriedia acidiceleris]|uniref:helix-turn-helix domain containing protein n=1 Tax=Gottfriedia acidiceleris TaxID=371036 RepID=UPI00101D3C0B|nr:helix-turn-helix domain containing protein [Gottfriedia acidiceleris]
MIDVTKNRHSAAIPKRKRRNTVIVLEELDHTWDKDELEEIVKLWEEDVTIWEMEEIFQRPQAEVALAIMDQEIKGNIKPRKIGLGIIVHESEEQNHPGIV